MKMQTLCQSDLVEFVDCEIAHDDSVFPYEGWITKVDNETGFALSFYEIGPSEEFIEIDGIVYTVS